MKILFITDLHGHFDALAKLPAADMLLVGGDFTNFGSPEEFQAAMRLVEACFPNFLSVAGNLDPGEEADHILAGAGHLIGTAVQIVNGLRMMGVSGSHVCPRPTPYEWDDEARCAALASLPLSRVDILVTHAPPYGFGADVIPNGMHVGSKYVKRLAELTSPIVHLCGHIHEASGVFAENGAVLVNPGAFGDEGNYALLELPCNGCPVVTLGKAVEGK